MNSSMSGQKPGRPRIGDLLLGEGVLSAPGLERALAAQQRTRSEVRLGSALLGLGVITEDTLLGALARAHGCPTVGAAELDNAQPAAVKRLPSARAYRLNAMPYAIDKKTIRVAFADPSNIAAIDEVAAVTGCRVLPAVTSEVRLMEAHQKHYGRVLSRHFVSILKRLSTPKEEIASDVLQVAVPPPPPRFLDFGAPPSEADLQAELPSLMPGEPVEAAERSESPAETTAQDRFSDEYSLTEFLAEALDGVSLDDLWQAGGFDEELPLDLGEPLVENDDLERTRPSRRSPPSPPDDGIMDASA